jgi:ERCC4-type nuclease
MITIDSREPEQFQDKGDKVAMLEFGDAIIEVTPKKGTKLKKTLVVERKTPSDLMSSVQSARLNNQLAGCDMLIIQDPNEDIFLPRGVWDRLYNEDALRIIVNGIQRHTPVQYCTDIDDYFNTLRIIEKMLKYNEYGVLTPRRTLDKHLSDARIGPIAQIPGIGHELAARIIAKWPTVMEAMINVTYWDQIEGISKKKRNAAIKFLTGDEPDGIDA